MVNSHFDGSQNQRLLQREMERLHTDSSSHLDDALSALSFSFASPEMVSASIWHLKYAASSPSSRNSSSPPATAYVRPVAHASLRIEAARLSGASTHYS